MWGHVEEEISAVETGSEPVNQVTKRRYQLS